MLLDILADESFKEKHCEEGAFTRTRGSLPLQEIFSLIVSGVPSSITKRIRAYFDNLGVNMDSVPSKSAFSQRRYKIFASAFETVNHKLCNLIYKDEQLKTWRGFRLLAVDGSTVQLPKNHKTVKEFDLWYPKNGDSIVMARISMISDVLNSTIIDGKLLKMSIGERLACLNHFQFQKDKDITIYDRGYASAWLMQYYFQNNKHFVMRLPIETWNCASELIRKKQNDEIIDLDYQSTPEYKNYCAQLGLDDDLPIKLRLVRVRLSDGSDEVLATSLLDSAIRIKDFDFIYNKRWGIEEDYKKLKSRCKFEQFSGIFPRAIKQDFYAKIILLNINSRIAAESQKIVDSKTADKEGHYLLNNFECLCITMRCFGKLINYAITEEFIAMILNTTSRYYEKVRPNRYFPRNMSPSMKRYNVTYTFPV